MRIKSISISGLRSFGPEPVTLELGPRTVLIGPHGAGKSTVIMALEMLEKMGMGRSYEVPCLYDDGIQREPNPDIKVSATLLSDAGAESRCEIVIANRMPQPYVERETITKLHGDRKQEYELSGASHTMRREIAVEVRDELNALININKFQSVGHTYLASAVLGVDKFLTEQIALEFKAIYGDFRGFEQVNTLSQVQTVGIRETNGRLTLLRHLSVGMRTYLGLLAFLMTAGGERKGIMLIEEPDAGLHPDLLHHLAGVIKRASEHCQIVMTTNNPGMLSEFSETPEDVVVVERPFDYTELKRLERTPLEHWLKDYGLGHAWESGAIGGRMEVI
jgi:predicted ATP-dependent endonuclease of OLD family